MDFTQVHVSGLALDADEASLVAAMQACGLSEESGWVTTKLVRDRETDRCRGFAFLSFTSRVQAEAAIELVRGAQATAAGAAITIELAKPKPKAKGKEKAKGAGGGAGTEDTTSHLKFRKKRLPTQPKHPESTTCSAVVGPRTQRRGQERGIVYGKGLHNFS